MFCTLRRSKDGCELDAFQMNDAPFRTKGRFSAVACINCRASKVRCTNEPEGCQRCVAKNRTCQYPGLRSNSSNRDDKHTRAPSGTPQVPNEEPTIVSNEDLDQVDKDVLDVDMGCGIVTPPETVEKLTEAVSSGDYPTLSDMMTESPLSFDTEPDAEYWSSAMGMPNMDTTSFLPCTADNETSMIVSATGTEQTCACFDRAFRIYESAEVNLIWGSKEQIKDAMEMLQQQKTTIVDCELLLGCPQCVRQSHFIMVLISLCDKLVNSLEHASHELQLSAPGGGPSSLSTTQQNWKIHDLPRFNVSNVSKRQLDEDDQRAVRASLFLRRVTKLHTLIGSIEKLVLEQYWSPHGAIVQELKERLRAIDVYITSIN